MIQVSALREKNTDELVKLAVEAGESGQAAAPVRVFSDEVEAALTKIEAGIAGKCEPSLNRWFAIKVFERDAAAIEPLSLTNAELEAFEVDIKAVEAGPRGRRRVHHHLGPLRVDRPRHGRLRREGAQEALHVREDSTRSSRTASSACRSLSS